MRETGAGISAGYWSLTVGTLAVFFTWIPILFVFSRFVWRSIHNRGRPEKDRRKKGLRSYTKRLGRHGGWKLFGAYLALAVVVVFAFGYISPYLVTPSPAGFIVQHG